jgi:hypothetical protein
LLFCMNQIKTLNSMRIKHLFIVALLFVTFSACQTSIQLGGQDDAFWNSKTTPTQRQQLVQDNERAPVNRQTLPENSNFTPIEKYDNHDPNRANNAYNEWNNRRNFDNNSNLNSNNNEVTQEQQDERDARRFGSQRNYYYDDPYFNSLSSNWGWTSFYNPIIRPGFYNWAPGWNIGLGWNSFNGWNTGFGFNSWGLGFGMGIGWNNWGWNRWLFYDPWYNPWSPWGWYDPFWGPYWGWRYNRWYNPWFGWNNFNNTGEALTNRPLLRPRASEGSNTGGSTLPPRGRVADMANPNSAQPAMPNPDNQRIRPNVNGAQQQHTTRPGGDLRMNDRGEPVYIRPSNPQRPADNNFNRPQMQNPNPQPGLRNDRVAPDYSTPNRSGGDVRQSAPPAMRRDVAPAEPRSAPQRNFDSPSPRGGMPSGGGAGGGSAPRSRPR